MTLWDYLHIHPWWGLIYLLCIITCVASITRSIIDLKCKQSRASSLIEAAKVTGQQGSKQC
jgi:hypothetical protein